MQNIQIDINADKILTITVDLKKRGRPSATGKTLIVATSSGNVSIGESQDEVKMGLNIYVPNPEFGGE